MPLIIVRNDITKMKVDAIVNAANQTLLGGGGVDGAIHHAAGPGLLAECRTLGGCETGSAKLTGAYRLPCKYVIHTVGPRWRGGNHGERDKLVSCYRTSLTLAAENECETVAFPLISSGIYGYPKDKALKVAIDTISDFLFEHDMTVYIVIYDRAAYQIGEKLFQDIAEYIDDHYVEEHTDSRREQSRSLLLEESENIVFEESSDASSGESKDAFPMESEPSDGASLASAFQGPAKKKSSRLQFVKPDTAAPTAKPDAKAPAVKSDAAFLAVKPGAKVPAVKPDVAAPMSKPGKALTIKPGVAPAEKCSAAPAAFTLDEAVRMMDESFSEMLLRKIDESGITDAQCYKKANIDRKLFSKIRSDKFYKPSKPTVLAFAIALELSLDETREMLMKAGFALSHSNKFDIIVEFFISHKNYNIFEINEALFAFDQSLLGA